MMGWVNCFNAGASWANIWHLSPNNRNTPRNPSLYFHMSGRYLHTCMTNGAKTNGNLVFNTSYKLNYGTWYHIT